MECEGFDPYIATERQRHHVTPPASAASAAAPATAKERMRAKLGTESGRALYARRKTIVEPVFGQIEERGAFAGSCCGGLTKIRGEWRLVCLTHNLLKIWRYGSGFLRGSRCPLIN